MVEIATGPSPTGKQRFPMSTNTSVPRRHTSTAQRRANAIAKAETLAVDYYLDGDTMIIASETTPGKLYVVTSHDCSCPAGRQELPCKHAAYRLNVLMPRTAKKSYTAVLADADELF